MSLTSCWAAFAFDTLGGFVAGAAWKFVEPDGSRSSSGERMAVGESRRSSLWCSLIVSMPRDSADWFCYQCGRLEFVRRSVTSRIQILMTASGHNAPNALQRTASPPSVRASLEFASAPCAPPAPPSPSLSLGRWATEHAAIQHLSYAESLRSPYLPLRHHSVRQPSRIPESDPGLCAHGYHDGMRSLFTGSEETTAS